MQIKCIYNIHSVAARANQVFNFRLDSEDRSLLDALAEVEKLSRGDVLRRALRHYAKTLGVAPHSQRSKKK